MPLELVLLRARVGRTVSLNTCRAPGVGIPRSGGAAGGRHDRTHAVCDQNVLCSRVVLASVSSRLICSGCNRCLSSSSACARSYNNRTYRVEDIDWDQRPGSQFALEDGSRVTYIDYYQQQYNLTVRDRDEQPLLVAQPRRAGPRPPGQAAAQAERGTPDG